jgi:hypothetical protein
MIILFLSAYFVRTKQGDIFSLGHRALRSKKREIADAISRFFLYKNADWTDAGHRSFSLPCATVVFECGDHGSES